jgi:hypothetical protein
MCFIALFDFSKASSSVNYQKLCYRLHNDGMSVCIINLLAVGLVLNSSALCDIACFPSLFMLAVLQGKEAYCHLLFCTLYSWRILQDCKFERWL